MRIDPVGRRPVWPPVTPIPRLRRPGRSADERPPHDDAPDDQQEPGGDARQDDEGLGGHLDLLA